ncbi:MAG TPA: 16S rRNA (guanine(966)-N(2))-methyltransferase RsmD [Casimicrobiaceae bacterium]|nr:16S rRNA (guanine(966)-N(2))-methyltransferase RsmD [Casimicrobiaceae bacterium]
MRIIGGRFRGRVIRFPDAAGLRPTPDRVRETLFNWLGQELNGRRTLDLYAGSGALTLEALSRGAEAAVAVDSNPALVRSLAEAAKFIGASGLTTQVADARRFLARDTGHYDVIFLDPPFALDEWAWLLPACAARLADGGCIYAEAGRALEAPGGLEIRRHAKAGAVHYHLLVRAEAPASSGPP